MSINRINSLDTQVMGQFRFFKGTSMSNTPNLSGFFLRQLTNSLT